MSCESWLVGNEIWVGVTWATRAGVAINPTTVTLSVRAPDGTLTTYTGGQLSNPSTGLYECNLGELTLPGTWIYQWDAAGTLIAAADGTFTIRPSRVL